MGPPTSKQPTNVLPPKENALFKRIVKCYEQKQYKNGLKFAKQILTNPRFAEHGETLAMKGLILNCMGKKEEAYDHARRGLKSDVRSYVCWHVFGLIQRSDKKYDEAIKAYRNALKIDKENLQILRDLSLLQLQMRDMEGYKETRYLLFSLRPTQKPSWITLAVAHHLLEDYDTALKLLEEYRKTQEQPVKTIDYEYSELVLYQISVYREAGRLSEALINLDLHQQYIVDKLALLEMRGELYIWSRLTYQAEMVYRELIDRNPENVSYYSKVELSRQDYFGTLHADEVLEWRLNFYDEISKAHPKALAPKRLPLGFTTGAKFVSLLTTYTKSMLRKGVPPLFISLKSLYKDAQKVTLIEDLFLSFVRSLEKCQKFPDSDELEPPTTLLWVYYFLALHYDHIKNYAKALEFLDKASGHTPTLIEILTARAKVCKHSGDIKKAVDFMTEAQNMDTADRYVNSKCAKYMLKAGMIAEAEAMCGKFTREGSSPTENLNEMQCMWFQTECAQAYYDLSMLGEALKKCHEVDRHFSDIIDDQFDFHTYCVRKMTLTAYVRMLRLEDTLRRHKWYYKAARVAILIYIRLHDKPFNSADLVDGNAQDEIKTSEYKKQRRKEKKQQARHEQMLKAQQVAAPNAVGAVAQNKPSVKRDEQENDEAVKEPLDPLTLVKPANPLDEAMRFLKPLIQLKSPKIESYLLGFEVFLRRNKLLMMLHCLKKAHEIDPSNVTLQGCRQRFTEHMSSNKTDSSILEIVLEELKPVYNSQNVNHHEFERKLVVEE